MITRRTLFRAGLGFGALALPGRFGRFGLLNAYATPASGYKALVCVFLFGGNDSNNMVVPMDSARLQQYTAIRKNLALAANTLLPIQTADNQAFGLHPALKEMQGLFTQKEMAIVANVGSLLQPLTRQQYLANQNLTPANLFSHSDQQMQWQTTAARGVSTTGWGGRLADQVSYMNGSSNFPTLISVAGNSLFGSGQTTKPGTVTPGAPLGLRGYDTSAPSTARMASLQELLTLDSGVSLVHQASSTLTQGISNSSVLSKALAGAPALKTVFPAKNTLSAQLEEVAKIIQVRQTLGLERQIFFCSLGGFDTHTAQLTDQQNLYTELSAALQSFYLATQELGVADSVATFTESDFSRTLQPNSNGGSDHAWGSHHMVLGGAVKGGALYGKYPALELNGSDDAGGEGRWIPSTAIDQYGATLASWFGVSPGSLPTVFPNLTKFSTQNLGFLG